MASYAGASLRERGTVMQQAKAAAASFSIFVALVTGACSSQQAYSIGQGWQRNQCDRLPERAEAQRCTERGGPSYDAYEREVGAQRTR